MITKPSTIPEFLKYIEKKYNCSPSWLGERAGLDGSTVRRWKSATRPFNHSLRLIEAVISKDFPDEVSVFKDIVAHLDAPVCKKETEPPDDGFLSSKLKELEEIIRARFPDNTAVHDACECVARLLPTYGYEFALQFAKNVEFQEEESPIIKDALSDYYDYRDALPNTLKMARTDFCEYTFRIEGIEGFFADIFPTPHHSSAIYLWHESCGQKMLVHDVRTDRIVELFGDIKTGVECLLQEIFTDAIMTYCEAYLMEDDDIDECWE